MDRSIANYVSCGSGDTSSRTVLANAMRAIERLSEELDRTRAERDQLRALVGSLGKAHLGEAA